MQFFIHVVDGQPQGNPIDRDSLLVLGQGLIPAGYEVFMPSPPPSDLGVYEVINAAPAIARNGETWTHDWGRRPMSEEQKQVLIADVQAIWAANGYPSWTWNEAGCCYVPPVAPPADGGPYQWDEAAQQWIAQPQQ